MHKIHAVLLFLLVCVSQITASSNPRPSETWRGNYLNTSLVEKLALLVLPNNKNAISQFEKELKSDMRNYLRWVARKNNIDLQDKDIIVTMDTTDFDKESRTITCFVTGKYGYYADTKFNEMYTDTLDITVGIDKRPNYLSTCSVS